MRQPFPFEVQEPRPFRAAEYTGEAGIVVRCWWIERFNDKERSDFWYKSSVLVWMIFT